MILVDTNVLSELARPAPDQNVVHWARTVPLPLSISVVTLEEIHYGSRARPNLAIEAWFETFLAESCVVLPITPPIAARAGQLRGGFRRDGPAAHASGHADRGDGAGASTGARHPQHARLRRLRHPDGQPVRGMTEGA